MRKKCKHEYFINEDERSECKNCGLLESTIKVCYPDENTSSDNRFQELQDDYHFYAKLKIWCREKAKECDKELDKLKKQIGELSKK